MSKTSWCQHTHCPDHRWCEMRQGVGRAVLSPAAEVTWLRTEDDPGEYLIIEAEGRTVRLTQDEVAILATLLRNDPNYYTNPFSEINNCSPENRRKDTTNG